MKLLFLLMFLVSCGSNKGSDDSSPQASSPHITTSYYVADASKLIACDDSSRGFLAYIENLAQFEACLSSGWTVVDVKGKDGSNGAQGSTGAAGTPTSANQWYDAITTKMWIMTTISTSTVGWTNSLSACTGSYRMPSPSEIMTALTHGMKPAAQALTNAPAEIIANDGQTYNVSNGALNNTGSGAQFCIAQ